MTYQDETPMLTTSSNRYRFRLTESNFQDAFSLEVFNRAGGIRHTDSFKKEELHELIDFLVNALNENNYEQGTDSKLVDSTRIP